jgi:hypothetical protein
MFAHLAGALITRECAIETHEPSCVPRTAKPFFILMVHSSLRAMGHVVAPELSHRGGRVWSHEAHDSARALSCGEAGSIAEGHVAVPELTSTVKRGLELRNTW